ncbi:MAG: polyketide synthase dehydratase domain-containing protein [Phycisphaerales bacterium]|jgi:3-hydroxyacyl-[acyl-carrier-protein] dehydratase|nr:polyketide synthase dehydratase domain-containing protein [Phycisphaerales bacterium]
MTFDLVDHVAEQSTDHITTLKHVSPDEEYLADHFPGFPILPGVLMLESFVQAASRLLSGGGDRMVLGEVKAVKYGAMVRPGESLRTTVNVLSRADDGSVQCRGKGTVQSQEDGVEQIAVSGRFTVRPARLPGATVPPEFPGSSGSPDQETST